MLKSEKGNYYKVKSGQSIREIAAFFGVSAFALARENGLREEPKAGRILTIPSERGNAYTAQEGDTPTLLCGSAEAYARRNSEGIFYLGMRIIL